MRHQESTHVHLSIITIVLRNRPSGMNRNSALGWDIRQKRLFHLTLVCSRHSHAFTFRVDCPLRSPWYPRPEFLIFTLGLIINVLTFDNNLFTYDKLTPPLRLARRKTLKRCVSSFFVSALLVVHPLVPIIDQNWFDGIAAGLPISMMLVYWYIFVFVYFCFHIYTIFCPSPLRNQQPSYTTSWRFESIVKQTEKFEPRKHKYQMYMHP